MAIMVGCSGCHGWNLRSNGRPNVGASCRVRKGRWVGSREVEKQQRLKTTFAEPLAAIAAGFSSEMEREAIDLIKEWLSQELTNVLLLDKLSGGDEKLWGLKRKIWEVFCFLRRCWYPLSMISRLREEETYPEVCSNHKLLRKFLKS